MSQGIFEKKRNRLKRKGAVACVILMLLSLFAGCGKDKNQEEKASFSVQIADMQVNHQTIPLAIDELPSFSWKMKSNGENVSQSAYEIKVYEGEEQIWSSGRTESGISIAIPYEGNSLKPTTEYAWDVTVWDEKDEEITSDRACFFTGLLGTSMGDAKWLSAKEKEPWYEEIVPSSISYTMTVQNTTASFLFGALQGRYGESYRAEISDWGEESILRFLYTTDGGHNLTELGAFGLGEVRNEESQYRVFIGFEENRLVLTVNEQNLGFVELCFEETEGTEQDVISNKDPLILGSIGYYKSRGESFAYLDDILILDETNTPIYAENFEEETNIFSPFHTLVEEENGNHRMKFGSGMLLTKGYEDAAPIFRKEFSIQDISKAMLYITGLGSVDMELNGESVSEEYFAPGKYVYNRQLTYSTYDVTKLLKAGVNQWDITLLHGWYDRAVGYPEIYNPWGDTLAVKGFIRLFHEDGTFEDVITDEAFRYTLDGPVREDDIYQGEFYDARKEEKASNSSIQNWSAAGVDEVDEFYDTLPLVSKISEPIICVKELAPICVTTPKEGVYVYDFGQNFSGTVEIQFPKALCEEGNIVTLRYGEALNEEELINKDDTPGTVWTLNLLTAEATDYYVMSGREDSRFEGEIFEPRYTYHGFRYLQIEGVKEAIPEELVVAKVLSSNLASTGTFTSSDELLNAYYDSTVWSLRSNFLDNPTDCNQRDERHGWAGDAQIFSKTGMYHADAYNFYRKYIKEHELLQSDGGSFSDMAPRNFGTQTDGRGGAASHNCWGDAPVILTWNLYVQYGDPTILSENLDMLCQWVDALESTSEGYLRDFGGYGDHLSSEDTPWALTDTAWCAHSAELVSQMARICGQEERAKHYEDVSNAFKEAWRNAFLNTDGTTVCNTQTSYALGLAFDMVSKEEKETLAANLDLLGQYSLYEIHTGYAGIAYLLEALAQNGYGDTAYAFLQRSDAYGLLYPQSKGATTTWESLQVRQDSENGYVLNGSLNHYAYGAVASFLYSDVLGIQPDSEAPGYKHFYLQPLIPRGSVGEYANLSFAKGSYVSPYGEIKVSWEKQEDGTVSYEFTVPPNTAATVILCGADGSEEIHEVGSGNWTFVK